MVSENILVSPSIPSSFLTAEHALYFACSALKGECICTRKPQKAELGSDTGEGSWAEPSHSQSAEKKELGSQEL